MRTAVLIIACLCLTVTAWGEGEEQFQQWMQTAGATVGSLQKNLQAKNGDGAAADAQKLKGIFADVHDFFHKKNVDDAMKFAKGECDGFDKVAQQARAGKFDEASATLKATTANCGGCHGAHRVKNADGSSTIKY
jgi:cytochrome c556